MAADLEEHGLRCVTDHFVARCRRRCRGQWTWRRRNKGGRGERRWHRSKPDYFMAPRAYHKRFRRCKWVLPQRGRKQTPFGKKKKGELTEGDKMFEALAEKVEKPRRRERAKNK